MSFSFGQRDDKNQGIAFTASTTAREVFNASSKALLSSAFPHVSVLLPRDGVLDLKLLQPGHVRLGSGRPLLMFGKRPQHPH